MAFLTKSKGLCVCLCVSWYLEADYPHQLSSKFCRADEEMLASRPKGKLMVSGIQIGIYYLYYYLLNISCGSLVVLKVLCTHVLTGASAV